MRQLLIALLLITLMISCSKEYTFKRDNKLHTESITTPLVKMKIAVIGSSSAYGRGATPIDSSWVNLLKSYLKGIDEIDTIYNLAISSATTYYGMPSGYVPPPNRYTFHVGPNNNVTKALSKNPDIVLINYPSNDIGNNFLMRQEYLANLRVIYNTVINAGKIAYVSTTQPRNWFTKLQKDTLLIARDSILLEYGSHAMNFFDPIADVTSRWINPVYNYDGTHVNNKGHRVLFNVAKDSIKFLNN